MVNRVWYLRIWYVIVRYCLDLPTYVGPFLGLAWLLVRKSAMEPQEELHWKEQVDTPGQIQPIPETRQGASGEAHDLSRPA